MHRLACHWVVVRPVPVQMWTDRACLVPGQTWHEQARPRCRCGWGVSPGRGIALASLLQGVKVHCGIDDAIVQEALAESKEITLER